MKRVCVRVCVCVGVCAHVCVSNLSYLCSFLPQTSQSWNRNSTCWTCSSCCFLSPTGTHWRYRHTHTHTHTHTQTHAHVSQHFNNARHKAETEIVVTLWCRSTDFILEQTDHWYSFFTRFHIFILSSRQINLVPSSTLICKSLLRH